MKRLLFLRGAPWQWFSVAVFLLSVTVWAEPHVGHTHDYGLTSTEGADSKGSTKIKVVTSIKPLALLARDILAETADVHVLLPPNADPHNASLRVSDRRLLDDADLLLWLGPELEQFLAKIASQIPAEKQLRVDQMAGLEWLPVNSDDHGHAHEETAMDMHVWLNAKNGQVIASAIADHIAQHYPSAYQGIAASISQTFVQWQRIDKHLQEKLIPFRDTGFVAYHDAYHYFVARYRLRQIAAVNQLPEQSLSTKQLLYLSEATQHAACLMAERSGRTPERLAARFNLSLVFADPLGGDANIQSYGKLLQVVGQNFLTCLSAKKT